MNIAKGLSKIIIGAAFTAYVGYGHLTYRDTGIDAITRSNPDVVAIDSLESKLLQVDEKLVTYHPAESAYHKLLDERKYLTKEISDLKSSKRTQRAYQVYKRFKAEEKNAEDSGLWRTLLLHTLITLWGVRDFTNSDKFQRKEINKSYNESIT